MTMHSSNNVSVEQWCTYYKVETTFVHALREHGLIELIQSEETYYIDFAQLPELERFIHLHYDLNINLEGLEAISHLLGRVNSLQAEVKRLRNLLNPDTGISLE